MFLNPSKPTLSSTWLFNWG